MRKLSILTFIICLVFVLSILTASSEGTIVDSMQFQGEGTKLTLDEAIDTALKGNASIIKSQMNLEQTQVSYVKNKNEINRIKKNFEKLEQSAESLLYMQNITLPLLNIDSMLLNTKMSLDSLITGQKSAVEQLYFNLQQAEEQSYIQKENLEISKTLYEKINKKYELGLVAKQEVLNGEMNVLNAEVSYKATMSSLSKLKMSMNNLLGMELMNELILTDELEYRSFNIKSIAKTINEAFTNSDTIRSLELAYQTEELKLKITERQYPEGTYAFIEQKINVDKALKAIEDERSAIELEVRQNYLDVMQKQEEIKSGEKSVELAEEVFKLSQAAFYAGLGLMTDVQSAQLSLQQKKLSLSKAILDYNLTALNFYDFVGIVQE